MLLRPWNGDSHDMYRRWKRLMCLSNVDSTPVYSRHLDGWLYARNPRNFRQFRLITPALSMLYVNLPRPHSYQWPQSYLVLKLPSHFCFPENDSSRCHPGGLTINNLSHTIYKLPRNSSGIQPRGTSSDSTPTVSGPGSTTETSGTGGSGSRSNSATVLRGSASRLIEMDLGALVAACFLWLGMVGIFIMMLVHEIILTFYSLIISSQLLCAPLHLMSVPYFFNFILDLYNITLFSADLSP